MNNPRGGPGRPGADALDQTVLDRLCAGRALARRWAWVDEVDSTQEELRRLASAREGLAEAGLLVAAGRQTAGRGRRGRVWFSPADRGLWFSLLFVPPRPRAEWPFVTALAALALRRSLAGTAGLRCDLKWPNDLLYEGRKVAGILAETVARAVALGIGVNLTQAEEEFPEDLRDLAVSVAAAAGRAPGRGELLAAFLDEFDRALGLFGREGPAPFRNELRSASILIGRQIWLSDGRAGRVVDIGATGELLLETGIASRPAEIGLPRHASGPGPVNPATRESKCLPVAGGEVVRVEPPVRRVRSR